MMVSTLDGSFSSNLVRSNKISPSMTESTTSANRDPVQSVISSMDASDPHDLKSSRRRRRKTRRSSHVDDLKEEDEDDKVNEDEDDDDDDEDRKHPLKSMTSVSSCPPLPVIQGKTNNSRKLTRTTSSDHHLCKMDHRLRQKRLGRIRGQSLSLTGSNDPSGTSDGEESGQGIKRGEDEEEDEDLGDKMTIKDDQLLGGHKGLRDVGVIEAEVICPRPERGADMDISDRHQGMDLLRPSDSPSVTSDSFCSEIIRMDAGIDGLEVTDDSRKVNELEVFDSDDSKNVLLRTRSQDVEDCIAIITVDEADHHPHHLIPSIVEPTDDGSSRLEKLANKIRMAKKWIQNRKKEVKGDGTSPGGDSFLEKFNLDNMENTTSLDEAERHSFCGGWFTGTYVVDPSKPFHYRWLTIVSAAIFYNLVLIVARSVFWRLNNSCPWIWFGLDYISDGIYVTDMIVSARTGYLDSGLLVRDTNKLVVNYLNSWIIRMDAISLIPTDLFYFVVGVSCPDESIPCPVILRINRLFKVHRLFEFFDKTETRTNFPNTFRILKLVLIILIVIHWNGCFYFAVSYMVGFGTDRFVYNNSGPVHDTLAHQYIYCIYWSTMTLTAIGEAADPVTDEEYLFVVIDFLIGILIFATIVGNVGSMISNMNAARVDFQSRMDAVKQYMELRKVSKELEGRVIKWFDYLWNEKQSLDEESVTAILPDRLKAEIAIQVHLETLKKVKLFSDCESGLLQELVLKLRLSVFSPGDYVCRKGDVGREMYIVKRGKLSVVADDGRTIFATLSDGAVFGELSVLNIQGNKTGNRRSANVRSVGYSDIFVLSKTDLWDVLQDYPDAREVLIERGKAILRKDNLLDEEVLKRSQREQEGLLARSEKLTEGLESLNHHFERLLEDFNKTQNKLKKRIVRLENTINGLSPWTSSLTLDKSPQSAILGPRHSIAANLNPINPSSESTNHSRSISLRVRPTE